MRISLAHLTDGATRVVHLDCQGRYVLRANGEPGAQLCQTRSADPPQYRNFAISDFDWHKAPLVS